MIWFTGHYKPTDPGKGCQPDMKSSMNGRNRTSNPLLVLTTGYIAFLLILPSTLLPDAFKSMFSEEGPFEVLSIFAWLVLAAQLAYSDFRPAVRWPMSVLFTLFAFREADLNRHFTAEGMMKMHYYTKSAAPLGEKLVSGSVAFVFGFLLLYACFLLLRFVFAGSNWRSPAARWLAFAGVLFVATKALDQLPNFLLEKHGYTLHPLLAMYFACLEEGLELWVPIVLVWLSWEHGEELVDFAGRAAARRNRLT